MANPPSNTPLVTQPAGNNPVANPAVQPQPSVAPEQPRNAQGLTPSEMSRQAEAMSSRAQQTTPVAPTGTTQTSGTISSARTAPMPVQGIEAAGSRQETYVRPSNAAEVARLNNISLSEAEARINRANAAQNEGRLVHPAGVRVSYDPATNTYQDRLTKNYYAGFDPNLGHIFTPDQTKAIQGMFKEPAAGGIITPDKVSGGLNILNNAITYAESPSMALPFSNERTMKEDPANASKIGSMWETTLPPEYQLLINELRADRERLASGQDESSLLLKQLQENLAARESAEIASIQAKADAAREDQKIANDRALGRAKVFFASIGATGGSQEMQYVADTISAGERALRDIANAERDAISQARQAFTDKNFELAFKQVELAEKRRAEYKDSLNQIIDLKTKFEQMAMQKAQFNAQMEEHAISMESQRYELEGKRAEAGQAKIEKLLRGGYQYEDAPEVFQNIKKQMGWSDEELDSYMSIVKDDMALKAATSAQEQEQLALQTADKMLNLFDKLGVSGEIVIGDRTYQYQGQPATDVYEGTETDVSGFVYHWTVDKKTGQKTITEIGPYGKPQDGWTRIQTDQGFFNYNTNTGQYVAAQPSMAQTTWQQLFPNGSQSPFRSSDDPNQGQCGAFLNDLYGTRIMKDDVNDKLSVMSSYGLKKDPKEVQVGDTFLMEAGDTGHVGIVASVQDTPNGRIFTALESNMVPPNGRVISSTRQMNMNDPRLIGFASIPVPNLPLAGTDATSIKGMMDYATLYSSDSTPDQLTINGLPITPQVSESATVWADQIEQGFANISNVPAAERSAVIKALGDRQKESQAVNIPSQVLTKIDSSSEAKQLRSLSNLKNKIAQYRNLVDQPYGFESVGINKAALDSAYASLQVAWKEAANLGALTGPDLDLISAAIKPSSGITNYPSYLLSGGKKGVLSSLDQAEKALMADADRNSSLLISKYQKYEKSPFIQELISPFMPAVGEERIVTSDDGTVKAYKFDGTEWQEIN